MADMGTTYMGERGWVHASRYEKVTCCCLAEYEELEEEPEDE
jgi:hypothetical protein